MGTYLFKRVQENHRNYVTKVLISAVIFRRRLKTQRTSASNKKLYEFNTWEMAVIMAEHNKLWRFLVHKQFSNLILNVLSRKINFQLEFFTWKSLSPNCRVVIFFPNMSPAQSCPITKNLINLFTLVMLFCTLILFTLVK